jgi:hypothetical protein
MRSEVFMAMKICDIYQKDYTVSYITQPNHVSECVFCVIRKRSGFILPPYIGLECEVVCSVTSKDDLNVTELTVETWVSSVSVLRAD